MEKRKDISNIGHCNLCEASFSYEKSRTNLFYTIAFNCNNIARSKFQTETRG